jgi:hypothetical protein
MSTNDERAKDAEALLGIASDAWNQHQANCRITTVSGSLQKVCEAISAHLAARLDSLAGEASKWKDEHAFQAALTAELLPYQERAIAAEAELARLREWIELAKATDIRDPSERFGFQSAVCALTAHMNLAAQSQGVGS